MIFTNIHPTSAHVQAASPRTPFDCVLCHAIGSAMPQFVIEVDNGMAYASNVNDASERYQAALPQMALNIKNQFDTEQDEITLAPFELTFEPYEDNPVPQLDAIGELSRRCKISQENRREAERDLEGVKLLEIIINDPINWRPQLLVDTANIIKRHAQTVIDRCDIEDVYFGIAEAYVNY